LLLLQMPLRRDGGIGERCYPANPRHRINQDILMLVVELWRQKADPGDTTAGLRKRRVEALAN